MQFVYLDYAATTPVDPRVADKMSHYLTLDGTFGNPASSHMMGQAAREAVEQARAQVASLIRAEPSEIIWTSGATEANNLALKGAAALYQAKGKHIITMKTEHPSVLDSCQQLEKEGFFVTYLTPEKTGLLDLATFQSALRADTILVSIMHVNNETGIVQDIPAIANITSSRGILFHVDAAQSAGKIGIDLQKTPVDLMSFSAHKIYGPKGVGALYLRRKPRVRVAAQIHGGGHQHGMRSGTLATHQIVGMGEAFYLAQQHMQRDQEKITYLRELFLQTLRQINAHVNVDPTLTIPHMINFRIDAIPAEKLMQLLPELIFSSISACHSKGSEPSSVLRALGQTTAEARCGVRISFGRFTCEADINFAIEKVIKMQR